MKYYCVFSKGQKLPWLICGNDPHTNPVISLEKANDIAQDRVEMLEVVFYDPNTPRADLDNVVPADLRLAVALHEVYKLQEETQLMVQDFKNLGLPKQTKELKKRVKWIRTVWNILRAKYVNLPHP